MPLSRTIDYTEISTGGRCSQAVGCNASVPALITVRHIFQFQLFVLLQISLHMANMSDIESKRWLIISRFIYEVFIVRLTVDDNESLKCWL